MENLNFRLDKSFFQALSFEEAEGQIKYTKNLTPEEKINHFNYFMSVAYGFLRNQWPPMDKAYFEKKKRS